MRDSAVMALICIGLALPFIAGGALSSAADIISEQAYQRGQADMIRMMPIRYLTEVNV